MSEMDQNFREQKRFYKVAAWDELFWPEHVMYSIQGSSLTV
jgi:hypothetical protein